MLGDEHFAAREAVVRLVHSTLGEFPVQNVVPKLSGTPGRVSRLGPELGQDNDDVYGRLLGIGADELAKLKSRGVV